MRTIGIFEAKTHLSEIVKSGEEVCLTNRGKEIAIIVPFEKYRQIKFSDAFERLQTLKQRLPLGDIQDIIDLKNEGRK
jgi:prevent-host-death family protein